MKKKKQQTIRVELTISEVGDVSINFFGKNIKTEQGFTITNPKNKDISYNYFITI